MKEKDDQKLIGEQQEKTEELQQFVVRQQAQIKDLKQAAEEERAQSIGLRAVELRQFVEDRRV